MFQYIVVHVLYVHIHERDFYFRKQAVVMTYLCGSGGPPAWGGGGGRGCLPAEAPLLAAAVRQRLRLQGLEGHGASGLARH